MFLKSLSITYGDGTIIRDIQFHSGLNLIVDETPAGSGKETGNNVGKTTVLKLVDFCLGAKAKRIYSDQENNRNEYKLVKDFLFENKVCVSLLLKDDLFQEVSREVLIERNFLSRRHKIQRIDGNEKTDNEFEETLTDLFFPGHYGKKPTFRQIIAHNIRYEDLSINNTLKNLNRYTRDDEYETLYLFLFGCDFDQGDTKQELRAQIDIEEKFRRRLESEQTKSAYEAALNLIQADIEELECQKASLNLNPNFESDLEKLNKIKFQINLVSSEIGRLELRRELISEAQKEMQASKSNIDLQQLQQIYQQATSLVSGLQKTFQDLYDFHNRMVESKIKFIVKDLPVIDSKIATQREYLNHLLAEDTELS
ncbi:MAG: AAA family ATPase, partial [Desulfobulbaceae bacterium]|nr:AAA family ATPase [Desulfobulbaceae bacterium]